MKKAKGTGWAVTTSWGDFYSGWRYSRADMIASHVHAFRRRGDPEVSEFARGRNLSPEQRQLWAARKRAGDRCVKVEIREI